MDVTVVIPAFNSSLYIAQTLESVLNQTVKPFEVLAVDDGSTDDTAEIAERFGHSVRVIRTANMKQAASRNFGVQAAVGDWIAFVDADDLWEPNKLELQIAELSRHPDADVCYTSRRVLIQDETGSRLQEVIPAAPPETIRQALFENTNFLPSSVLIRRSTFLGIGGFDPHFVFVQDWDLWLRLLHSGARFAACLEPLMQYRVHDRSVTMNNARAAFYLKDEIYRRHVLPYLPKFTAWFSYQRCRSGHESCAAYLLRKANDRSCIPFMAASIFRNPLREPKRYLVLAHALYMLATKGMVLPQPSPTTFPFASPENKRAHARHPDAGYDLLETTA